jgi:acyl carrier protein
MGLDGVELVMAVEEEFKIAISDADAAECVTVGKLVDLVDARLRHDATEPCPSQRGFHAVRKHLIHQLGVKRAEVKPGTALVDLIGCRNRRNIWRELVGGLTDGKTKWPGLVRPKWMNLMVFLVVPFVVCLGLVVFTWWPFAAAFPVALGVAFLGDRLTVPFKREFPKGFSQVQDLIKFVGTLDTRTWSKDEVFQKIRAITVEQLGVKESHVTLEANFVKDLGVG